MHALDLLFATIGWLVALGEHVCLVTFLGVLALLLITGSCSIVSNLRLKR